MASYESLRDLRILTLIAPNDLTAALQDPLSFANSERGKSTHTFSRSSLSFPGILSFLGTNDYSGVNHWLPLIVRHQIHLRLSQEDDSWPCTILS
jgi:hypothetical protein